MVISKVTSNHGGTRRLGAGQGVFGMATNAFFSCCLCSDTEVALKKEGLLPEGPALEALLCAEAVDKKMETKDEESISECQVGAKNRGG